MRSIGLVIAISASVAAAAGFAYAPSGATRWNDQYRSTLLQIPSGTVELASFGIVDLTADQTTPIHAIHVRMIVSNNADERPWTLDASATTLGIGDVRIASTMANSDLQTLPLAIVGRGERAVIDHYFALPKDSTGDPSQFDVAWTLRTARAATTQHTRFSVDATPPPRSGIALAAGWGSRWWFDRSYPWPSFLRHSGIIAPRPPKHIAVSRQPARHEPRISRRS